MKTNIQKRTSNRISFEWGTTEQDTFSNIEEIRPEFKGKWLKSEMYNLFVLVHVCVLPFSGHVLFIVAYFIEISMFLSLIYFFIMFVLFMFVNQFMFVLMFVRFRLELVSSKCKTHKTEFGLNCLPPFLLSLLW
jgi:hypothetical protein